jgi:multidrug efflux pump subunit AcrA (membrane-fusion protein)
MAAKPSRQEFGMLLRRAHIPQEELSLGGVEEAVVDDDIVATAAVRARIQHELLQIELDLLRARLNMIRAQVRIVAKSSVTWANASARSQLLSYPWIKLGALAAGSFLATTALRRYLSGRS